MAISRMQQPRQQYGLGSIVKGVKKAVKGVAKGIKSAAKSPIGKAAMLYFGGNLLQGNAMFGNPFTGRITDFVASKGIPSVFSNAVEGYKNLEGPKKFLAQAGIGTAISGGLAALMNEDEETREMASQDVGALRKYLSSYYSNLGYNVDQIAENVERDTSEYGYADGGRIGYAFGDKVEMAAGIEGLPVNVNPKGVKELDLRFEFFHGVIHNLSTFIYTTTTRCFYSISSKYKFIV